MNEAMAGAIWLGLGVYLGAGLVAGLGVILFGLKRLAGVRPAEDRP